MKERKAVHTHDVEMHSKAGGTEGMSLGFQATAWVNDVLATIGVITIINQLGSFVLFA